MTPLLLGLALAVGAPAKKDPPPKEPTLVGDWVVEKMVMGGMEIPAEGPLAGMRISFAADGSLIARQGGGQKPETGSYKVDAKKDPPEIDLLPPADQNEPPSRGIYKLDGEVLTLCLAHGKEAERPKKLESPAGSMVMVLTLRRAKND